MENDTKMKTVRIGTVGVISTFVDVMHIDVAEGNHLWIRFADGSHTCYAAGQWLWFRVEEQM